jgi:hypothetical protein
LIVGIMGMGFICWVGIKQNANILYKQVSDWEHLTKKYIYHQPPTFKWEEKYVNHISKASFECCIFAWYTILLNMLVKKFKSVFVSLKFMTF